MSVCLIFLFGRCNELNDEIKEPLNKRPVVVNKINNMADVKEQDNNRDNHVITDNHIAADNHIITDNHIMSNNQIIPNEPNLSFGSTL